MTLKSKKTCWVIYDKGKVGTANQCLGLAQKLGFESPKIIEIVPRFPWKYLPPSMWLLALKGVIDDKGNFLSPPWPDLIIAAGRVSVAPTAMIRKITAGKTKVIQLQNPRIDPERFDAVIAPAHDLISGKNVIVTNGALHRVTYEKINSEAKKFSELVKGLPKPYIMVLVGGTNRKYDITPAVIKTMSELIISGARKIGASVLVTPSRRTEPENKLALEEAFRDYPSYVWDGTGDNPYFGFMGLADYILVTSDSVSMTSEACFTGKPVYTYHLPGTAGHFTSFHNLLTSKGYTRPFECKFEQWSYEPLDEFDMVVQKLKKLI